MKKTYFEYSPLEILEIETAYDMAEPFLKPGHKVVIRKNPYKGDWSYRVLPLSETIGHFEYATYVVEVKKNNTLVIASVGDFN